MADHPSPLRAAQAGSTAKARASRARAPLPAPPAAPRARAAPIPLAEALANHVCPLPDWNDPIWNDPVFADPQYGGVLEALEVALTRRDQAGRAESAAPAPSAAPSPAPSTAVALNRLVEAEPDPHPDALPPDTRKQWTGALMRDFLVALAGCHNVSEAARAVGMSRQSAYALRAREGEGDFAAAWDQAMTSGLGSLYEAMLHRATHGTTIRHYYQGQHTHDSVRYDERLAMYLLRSARSERQMQRAGLGSSSFDRVHGGWGATLQRIVDRDQPECCGDGASGGHSH